MKPAFNCLYYLEDGTTCIVEIKRNDLAADADISEVFRWLMIDLQSSEVTGLDFRSMDRSDNVEERFFDQGYLKFNPEQGTFIEKFNSAQHQLVNKTKIALPENISTTIADYLVKIS
jgi:hypothetical protein